MANIQERALKYVTKAFGGRDIYLDPKGKEPGFYLLIKPSFGEPYYSKIARLVTREENPSIGPAIVDVTGDRDRVLAYL